MGNEHVVWEIGEAVEIPSCEEMISKICTCDTSMRIAGGVLFLPSNTIGNGRAIGLTERI